MSNRELHTLTALGVASALFAFACDRPSSSPAPLVQAAVQTTVPVPESAPSAATKEDQARAAAQVAELPPPTQTVKAPVVRPDDSGVKARERRLAEREAALATRERALKQAAPASSEPDAEPASAEPAPFEAEPPAVPDPAPAAPATVPSGTAFEVEFTKALASNLSTVGQSFRARIVADVSLDGSVVIPADSEVLGEVTSAEGARGVGGKAKLGLKFTDLVLPSGNTVPIQASFVQEGPSKAGKDAATIGSSTVGGAILGRILGSGRSGRSSILGALIGAAAGTAIASRTAGQEVVIPEGSVVTLRLDGAVEIHPPTP
jgi:hypothetical protein